MAKKSGKFILSVGDEGGILTYIQGKTVLRRYYAPTPGYSDTKGFIDAFQADPKAPVSMLVDVMDQSYVQHSLPPVSALSINNLIKRKMERDFAAEDLKGALQIGREKEGRRDWKYLFVTLSQTPQLQSWIDLLLELPNRFTGIYLLPVEAENFMRRLRSGITGKVKKKRKSKEAAELSADSESRWQLLVAHNKVGGFRQVVLKDGKLIFARLAQPIGDNQPEVIAGNIEQEISVTIEYLKRLGYSDDQGMDVYVITSDLIKSSIDVQNINVARAYVFSPHEAALKIGLDSVTEPADQFADVMMAAAFSTAKKQILKLETPMMQQLNMLHNGILGVKAGAVLAAVGAVAAIGYYGYMIPSAKSEIETAERQTRSAQQQLDEVMEQERSLPDNLETITDLVGMHQLVNDLGMTPLDALFRLKTVATPENMVLFEEIRWESQGSSVQSGSAAAAGQSRGSDTQENMMLAFTVNMYGTQVGSREFNSKIDAFNAELREAFAGYTVTLQGERPGGEQRTIISFDEQRDPILERPFYPLNYTISGNGIVGDATENNAVDAAYGDRFYD